MSLRRIESVEELHRYLQVALQLEHSTFPPYLTALYSIRAGTNEHAAKAIHSVVVEEMLHIALVANILNAVGGEPDLTDDEFIPNYPTHLPDGETDFEVSIRPFSPEAINTFLQIERPNSLTEEIDFVKRTRSHRALLPGYVGNDEQDELHFYSIGEFYQEIERGLNWLDKDLRSKGETLFSGDPSRQIPADTRWDEGGEFIAVTDLASALAAINLITEQGEGTGGAIYDEEGELSHYYRFEQILLGRYYQRGDSAGHPTGDGFTVDWTSVHPCKIDADHADFPEDTELGNDARRFTSVYRNFLALLTDVLNGQPQMLDKAIGEMFRLKALANQLVATPIPGVDGVHGAPVYRSRS